MHHTNKNEKKKKKVVLTRTNEREKKMVHGRQAGRQSERCMTYR